MPPRLLALALLGTLVMALFKGLPYGTARENELLIRLSQHPIALRFGLPAPLPTTRLYHLESTANVELYWALDIPLTPDRNPLSVPHSSRPTR